MLLKAGIYYLLISKGENVWKRQEQRNRHLHRIIPPKKNRTFSNQSHFDNDFSCFFMILRRKNLKI